MRTPRRARSFRGVREATVEKRVASIRRAGTCWAIAARPPTRGYVGECGRNARPPAPDASPRRPRANTADRCRRRALQTGGCYPVRRRRARHLAANGPVRGRCGRRGHRGTRGGRARISCRSRGDRRSIPPTGSGRSTRRGYRRRAPSSPASADLPSTTRSARPRTVTRSGEGDPSVVPSARRAGPRRPREPARASADGYRPPTSRRERKRRCGPVVDVGAMLRSVRPVRTTHRRRPRPATGRTRRQRPPSRRVVRRGFARRGRSLRSASTGPGNLSMRRRDHRRDGETITHRAGRFPPGPLPARGCDVGTTATLWYGSTPAEGTPTVWTSEARSFDRTTFPARASAPERDGAALRGGRVFAADGRRAVAVDCRGRRCATGTVGGQRLPLAVGPPMVVADERAEWFPPARWVLPPGADQPADGTSLPSA